MRPDGSVVAKIRVHLLISVIVRALGLESDKDIAPFP